jgi:hypothetical protein
MTLDEGLSEVAAAVIGQRLTEYVERSAEGELPRAETVSSGDRVGADCLRPGASSRRARRGAARRRADDTHLSSANGFAPTPGVWEIDFCQIAVLRVACTLSDLAGLTVPGPDEVAEALGMRLQRVAA